MLTDGFRATILLSAILLLGGSSGAEAGSGHGTTAKDFYRVPQAEIAGAAGTLLRAEPVPLPPGASAAYRIVYRSRGVAGDAIAVSGLVALPPLVEGAPERPIVSWGHDTTGIASDCAPSLASAQAFANIDGLHGLLDKGFVVVATDYQGLGEGGEHPYLAGASEGHALIDAARAVRALPGAHAGNRYATWGFSQGGHASLFAGALARSYAPDMHLVGVAAASAPTELRVLLHQDIGSPTGKVIASFAAWSWSQTYRAPIRDIVKPGALPNVQRIASTCSLDLAEDLSLGLDALGYQASGFLAPHAEQRPDWARLIARNSVPPLHVPVFLAQGGMDSVVEPAPTRDYVDRLCHDDAHVDYVEIPWASHGGAARASANAAVDWLAARFSGGRPPSDCGAVLAGQPPGIAVTGSR